MRGGLQLEGTRLDSGRDLMRLGGLDKIGGDRRGLAEFRGDWKGLAKIRGD